MTMSIITTSTAANENARRLTIEEAQFFDRIMKGKKFNGPKSPGAYEVTRICSDCGLNLGTTFASSPGDVEVPCERGCD